MKGVQGLPLDLITAEYLKIPEKKFQHEKEFRVSVRAREECKKKKSIQLASNALFLL
jgi:hypothetical protein